MILEETAIVSGIAAVVAIPFAFLAGRGLLAALAATHQVASGINFHFGVAALTFGLGDTLVASALAAYVTARRASKLNPRAALVSAELDNPGLGRKRVIAGFVCFGIGISCATLITTFFKNRGFLSESLAGEACIWTAIGFALFAPLLMRASGSLLGFPLRKSKAASAYLADINIRQRTSQMSGVLMPMILFTGIAAGALYMQSILNTANASEHIVNPTANKAVETLNFVVVAMIAVFAAVVLTNIAVATTLHRRREFGQQRLAGSTPPQVLWMVAIETLVMAITGLVFGTVAALTTIVPFSIAIAHTALPHVGPEIFIGVVITVFVLTFLANVGASRRAIQLPILDAVVTAT
jgi:putative ABC transport system permease protein